MNLWHASIIISLKKLLLKGVNEEGSKTKSHTIVIQDFSPVIIHSSTDYLSLIKLPPVSSVEKKSLFPTLVWNASAFHLYMQQQSIKDAQGVSISTNG